MSATPNIVRDPRLLPGASAFAITRACLLASLVGLLVSVPFAILLVGGVGGRPAASGWLLGVFVGVTAIALVIGLVARVRTLREKNAGYATLMSGPLDRDLVDRHTGEVLWRVGDPAPRMPGIVGIIRGDQGEPARPRGAGEPAFPPSTWRSRLVGLLPYVASLAFVVVGLSIARLTVPPLLFVLYYLGIGAFAALVLGIVILITRLTLGRRIEAIATLRPTAMIFTSTRTRALANAATELGSMATPSGRFAIVAADAALEFWGSAGDSPWMSLPWADIVALRPGSTSVGQNTFRAITLGVKQENRTVPLTLALYGRRGTFNAPVAWANQIFDEIQFHLSVG